MPMVTILGADAGTDSSYSDCDGYGFGDCDGYGFGHGNGVGYGYGHGGGCGYGDGTSYGTGHIDGAGYGYGDDYGYGFSDRTGHGYGDGYGFGDDSGDGYDSGNGYGYGYGNSYGDSDSDGDGYGGGHRWPFLLEAYRDHLLVVAELAAGRDVLLGWWRSGADGLPVNGGSGGEPARPGLVQEVAGPLKLCRRGLHATAQPQEWAGGRWWVVALSGEIRSDGSKAAALRRVILEEVSVGRLIVHKEGM